MDLTDILASLFGGGQSVPAFAATQVGDHNNPAAFQSALARFAPPQGQSAPAMPTPQMQPPAQPQQPLMGAPAPQGQPDAQTAQASPAGGGVGGFLTDLFMPQTAAKNRTVGWLQQQGMDAGTANLIVQDPGMLRTYLQQKLAGKDSSDFEQRAAALKEFGGDLSPQEQRTFILNGKLDDGGKRQFTAIGEDAYGNKQYGFVDTGTGKVTPIQGQNATGNDMASNAAGALHGDDFLSTLSPEMAQQVKAFAEGRMPMPSGFALKSPYFQKMLQYITQYDPSFDAVNYNSRSKTRQDFTSGKSAQSINAINTAIGHLQNLSDSADSLDNSSIPMWNSVKNTFENQTGDPRIATFNTTKKAVVDEVTRVWRGTGGSEGDIKTWSDQLNAAQSPQQLHSVIGRIGDLLESKINSLGETYNQGMGTTASPMNFVNPASQAALNTLRARGGETTPNPSGSSATFTPGASQGAAAPGEAPPASYTGDAKLWKYMTPEQKKLWQ